LNITGIRGGAATLAFTCWDYEVLDLLVLKNNKGTEENRVRHLDYSVQLSKMFYERLIKGGDITLLSPDVYDGKLYKAFFEDQEEFERLYLIAEADSTIKLKKTIKAVELFSTIANERANTGRVYVMNVDNANQHGVFNPKKAPIRLSNLCVHPDTKILTNSGNKRIADLEDEQVTIWNGFEWSDVFVKKTNVDQELLEVSVSNGSSLKCTPYHKFWIKEDGKESLIEAKDLDVGMKIVKHRMPIIEGQEELDLAYEQGFYQGDGCKVGDNYRIYLYDVKKELLPMFNNELISNLYVQDNSNRIQFNYPLKHDKLFVPSSEYTVESRLKWLAGLLDADGCVYRNGDNNQLVLTSVEYDFLLNVQLMLNELGCQPKIVKQTDSGMKLMPDGKGDYKEYMCRAGYRLLLTSNDACVLCDQGLDLKRLEYKHRKPKRDARRFTTITSVSKIEERSDTFCVHEPKRNMVIFNGILTSQCQEIFLPTTPMGEPGTDEGEIALCVLGAFNLGKFDEKLLPHLSKVLVRALDNLLDYQDYPIKQASKMIKRRSLGIGITSYAYWLVKQGLKYTDEGAKEATHNLFEAISYNLIKASIDLARERGKCEAFDDTEWSKGALPIDTYKRDLDDVVSPMYNYDWDSLRKELNEVGMRNSTLMALMPSETSSQITNSTNGIEPPRGLVTIKQSKDGIIPQAVPELLKHKKDYQLIWNLPSNDAIIELSCIMQKFVCQGISTNLNYNPGAFPDGKLPIKVVLQDLLKYYKLGGKSLYYHNTNDGTGDNGIEDDGCSSGACAI